MNPSTTGKPPADEDLTARVDALETEVEAQGDAIAALTERVAALEGEEPPIEPPPGETIAGLSVTLDLPDGALVFEQSGATDLGDYLGEHVRQHCLMLRQGAWTLFFRPDLDGARQEVVVEYGGYDFSQQPNKPVVASPAHILEPYTATIHQDGAVLATVTVPRQYWSTRWRWQSAPRPAVRGRDLLAAWKAILPLDEQALWNNPPPLDPAIAWEGPMGTAGLDPAMGTTGDRQEIGPITDLQGSYLLRGTGLATILAQAEAAGSMPMWVRDINTNNLLDVLLHPYETIMLTANGGEYPACSIAPPPDDPNYFRLDTAHLPAVSFVPWLLTDDPYFLESCQAAAILGVCETNYYRLNEYLPGLGCTSQIRAWAWSMRDIFQMAGFSPEAPPAWLQPRSYFRALADDNLEMTQRCMASEVKACAIFHQPTSINNSLASWQQGYLFNVMGWARWTGLFPEWHDAIDWMSSTVLEFGSDPSAGGWDRRWPAPYYAYLVRARTVAVDLSVVGSNVAYYSEIPEPYREETPDSWGEMWALYQDRMALEGTPITIGGEDKVYQNAIDNPVAAGNPLHYHEVVLGAFSALALGGTPGAAERAAWLRAHLQAVYDSFGSPPSSFRYAWATM